MVAYVLASRRPVLPPPVVMVPNPFPGMDVTWTGWDGTVWQLNQPTSGVALLPGVRGFGTPPTTLFNRSSPALAGSRHAGHSVGERPVFWPVAVWKNTSSPDWVAHDRAFFRTLDPERPGVWEVRQSTGEARRLRLRFAGDGDPAFDVDPSRYGIQTYGLDFVANQPYWEGDPVFRRFQAETVVDFFSGPMVTIADGRSLASATVTNAGEVDSYATWTIIGPTTTATVGVGADTITAPFAVAAGKALQIDTNPDAQTALLGDWDPVARTLSNVTDRTGDLGATVFAPIPPGVDVSLNLTMTGTGAVEVEFLPLYKRAW